MTTETTTPINAAVLTVDELEALKGASVQINHDATDMGSSQLHMWAGKHGTLQGTNPFGAALIVVGKATKVFDRDQFVITAGPGAAPADAPKAEQTTHHVNLVEVHPLQAINSPTNPRRRRGLDLDSLRTMADSIATHGLMQPIVVRPLPASRVAETSDMDPRPAYELIAGERRWRAAQLAELATMPMLVRHLSDEAVLELQLVENIEREDLDAMEEAEGFALLRDKLGYTVEQIAERMGKGRGPSYVRKRMKLLDLTPASREAMYDGTLQLSTGLLVARYPADVQAQAVKLIKKMGRPNTTGGIEPAPFRDVVRALFNELHLVLTEAPFDREDPGLVITAGPCTTCPKRTGNNPDLFGEADTQMAGESCTDASCWAEKKTAHVQRAISNAQARGLSVMDEAEAAKLLPSPYSGRYIQGYEHTSATAYTETGNDGEERDVTYADALRAQGRKAPKPIVVIHPHTGKVFELIPDAVADKLVPAAPEEDGKAPRTPAQPAPVVEVPQEHRALMDQHVRRALFYRTFDAVRNRPRTVEDLRLAAIGLMCQTDDAHPHTEAFMGWSEAVDADDPETYLREKIEALDADQLGQVITMAAIEQAVDWYSGHLKTREQEAEFFTAQGIDILAVQAKVDEDLQRQKAGAGVDTDPEGAESDADEEAAA
jgi:ParB/RepB/Spo0J family partition protein